MIYVNGDSFSNAVGYLDNPGDCWPYYLIETTDPVVVDAIGGGSNYRIVRTSTETLSRIYPRVNHAIFAWTEISRWEKPGGQTLEGEQYFRHQHHLVEDETILIENFLSQILTLNNLCNALKINAWHMHSVTAPDLNKIDNDLNRQRLQNVVEYVDDSRWILPFNTSITAWATENKVPRTECNHLTKEGNAILASVVKNALQF
jgi:hypothetical protein